MSRISKSAFLLAVVMLFTASHVLPQSTTFGFSYTFPRFESPGTQLLIANVNNTDAVVRVTLYGTDGTTAASSRFSLSAGAQTTFGDADISRTSFLGAAIVESTVQLSVTASLSRSDALETYAPASSGQDLVIPFVRAGTIADTQVSIFNPGTLNADVTLVLGKPDGTQVTGSRLSLGPQQSTHISLNTLGRSDIGSVTHVFIHSAISVLTSSKPVFAVARIGSLDNGNGLVRQDIGIVQAVPSDKLSSSVTMPLFAHGFGYFTVLEVVNVSATSQSVTLTALGTDGARISGSTNPVTVSVPPQGAFSGNMVKIFGLGADTLGSISITGGGRLTAAAVLGNDKSPNLAVVEPADKALSTFALQFLSISRDFFDGLSFLNSSSVDAFLSLTFITNDGSTSSNAQITVPAGSQVIKTLADLLPEAQGSGLIVVSSSVPIQLSVLEGSPNVLTSLPVSAVAPGFNPRPQGKFLAVGKVTIAGVPMPGATVRLFGPVGGTQTTDSAGAYVFRDLPPGSYLVSIQLAGVQFTPSTISFRIAGANSRDNNFQGSILNASLTSITPSSVLAGSSSVQITATGGPFIPTSEIVFDGAVIPTSFVNENTLTGVVSAAALVVPRQVSVQVRNRVGSNFSPTQMVTFVVGTPAPVITSLQGVPNQIIAGNPGFTVTVIGSGFNDGGTIEIDGVPRTYIVDSPTQVHAPIGPADLAVGRFAKLTATNPGATVGPSNALPITVNNPVAGMLSISPNLTFIKIEPNATGLQLTVNGFAFKPGAKVQVASFPALSTTFVNSTTLIAIIPVEALQVGGVFSVTVSNPAPTLGTSEAQPLIIYSLVPQLASVDVGALTFAPGPTKDKTSAIQAIVVLHGSNYGTTSNALMKSPPGPFPSCGNDPANNPFVQVSTTRVSSTEMVALVPILCTGTYFIYASSNQIEPGGGTSQILSFTVTDPPTGTTPVLSSLVPPSTPANAAITLTINGSNFLSGALVNFGTAILTPTSVTSSAVVVTIPAYYLQKGIVPVTVTNPGVGGTSTRLLFFVN